VARVIPALAAFCYGEPAITQPLLDAVADAGQSFANDYPSNRLERPQDRMSPFAVQQNSQNSPC
jgi:hypothetical protein